MASSLFQSVFAFGFYVLLTNVFSLDTQVVVALVLFFFQSTTHSSTKSMTSQPARVSHSSAASTAAPSPPQKA